MAHDPADIKIHRKVPISQITPSTIVLGSSASSVVPSSPVALVDSRSPTPPTPTTGPFKSESTDLSNIESSSSTLCAYSNNMATSSTDKLSSSASTIIETPLVADHASPSADQDNPPSITSPVEPPERCTSPRRDSTAIEQVGREKLCFLRREALVIQESLTDILDRVGKVKDDYDRLSHENKFLQDYIGNLMSTSNILNKTARV